MSCSCSPLVDATANHFDEHRVRKELEAYRKAGPAVTTRGLLNLLAMEPPPETLLDIGAGLGVLAVGMLKAGANHAICVDLSPAAIAVSREEAERQAIAARIDWLEGDFVAIAASVPPADLVVLDRVVCCYPAYAPLLEQAAAHSRRRLAISFPRASWWVRLGVGIENAWRRVQGDRFRAFVHSPGAMAALLAHHGFRRVREAATWSWQLEIYARSTT